MKKRKKLRKGVRIFFFFRIHTTEYTQLQWCVGRVGEAYSVLGENLRVRAWQWRRENGHRPRRTMRAERERERVREERDFYSYHADDEINEFFKRHKGINIGVRNRDAYILFRMREKESIMTIWDPPTFLYEIYSACIRYAVLRGIKKKREFDDKMIWICRIFTGCTIVYNFCTHNKASILKFSRRKALLLKV